MEYFTSDIKKVKNSFYNSNLHHLNSKRDTEIHVFSLLHLQNKFRVNLWRSLVQPPAQSLYQLSA